MAQSLVQDRLVCTSTGSICVPHQMNHNAYEKKRSTAESLPVPESNATGVYQLEKERTCTMVGVLSTLFLSGSPSSQENYENVQKSENFQM